MQIVADLPTGKILKFGKFYPKSPKVVAVRFSVILLIRLLKKSETHCPKLLWQSDMITYFKAN